MIVPIYEHKAIAEWSFVNDTIIEIRMKNSSSVIRVDFLQLEKFQSPIIEVNDSYDEFEIIAVFEYEETKYYIYIEYNTVKITDKFTIDGGTGIHVQIKCTDDRFVPSVTDDLVIVKDTKTDWEYVIDERLFSMKGTVIDEEMNYDGEISGTENPHLFFQIKIGNYYVFYELYRGSRKYAMKYLKTRVLSRNIPETLEIEPKTFNLLRIKIGYETFEIGRDVVTSKSILLGKLSKEYLPFPVYFEVNGKFFALSCDDNKLIIDNGVKDDYLIETFEPRCVRIFDKIHCFGKLKYKRDVTSLQLDSIRTGANVYLTDVHRKGNFFYFAIKLRDIEKIKNFHNRLWIGNFIHRLKVNKKDIKTKNKVITNYKDNSILMRLNDLGMLSLSVVPRSKQYAFKNRNKQLFAYYLVRLKKRVLGNKDKVNLYFEKDCSRAEESAIRVFQNVMRLNDIDSKNYFILDEKASYFQDLKKKYPENLIKRFSFRHYYFLFLSSHLISSELSNHVVEVRVLNEKISKKINSTPLYFLQHGIMFAKPVENPMARGFYKQDMAFTLKKSVISSDLEAKEFYKMGYNDSELMKTGLATFDYAIRDNDADKIVYMPTYRYWEEKAVINGQLKETTYFFSIMGVIKAFESAGLINRLLITPHNKFAEYISKYMPEYEHIICNNPSEALKQSCIFISDYSSAIYDAIYRGAYPIFYWKDEDYLIQNYQATPPVNKQNAPGVIAYSEEELIYRVEEAIKRDYVIENDNLEKYRKINEFHDNNNTQRIINVLLNDGVL